MKERNRIEKKKKGAVLLCEQLQNATAIAKCFKTWGKLKAALEGEV